jgi:DUF4097 and DUF4098 domain-containing protein YvlB
MKALLFLLITSISIAAHAQNSTETPYLTKSLSAAAIEKIMSETSGGNITVNGVAPAETKIEVYIHGNNGRNNLSKEEIEKKLAEDYDLTVTTTGHELTAIARPKQKNRRNWNSTLSISFKIYAPVNVSTNLTTSGGNISLTHIKGTQDFTTSGGNLHIDDLSGKIKGVTSGGNIHLVNSSDDITLTTSGGNIEAKNNDGKLNLTTSGGNVTLEALKGTIEATTSGGSVRGSNVSGQLSAVTSGGNVNLQDMACSLSAATSGGNISVSMTTLGSYVKLSNSGGNIDLHIPANKGVTLKLRGDKVSMSIVGSFSGENEKDRVEGTLNGGGVPITVRGDGGRVSLTVK